MTESARETDGTEDAIPGAGGSRLPRALRPFRHRDYRLLAASMGSSLFASGVWLLAIVWQVIGLGGGPPALSLVTASASAGLLVSVLIGGVAADRLPRRAVLRAVEVVRIVAAGTATALALSGQLTIQYLAMIAFVIGAAEAFYFPAYSALLPTLVPSGELLAANGVEQTLRPVMMQAVGPGLAGLVVGAFVPGAGLALATAGYALALVPLLFLRVPPPLGAGDPGAPGGTDGRRSVLHDLREGFGYLVRTGWLFASLAFAMLYVLLIIGPIEVLLPFAVRDRAGSGPAGFAAVLAAYGIGGALGSIAVASLRLPRRYLSTMLLLWGAGALPLMILGLTTRVWVMAVASFLVGATGAGAMVIWGTLLQRRVPAHLLGRVSSLDFFVSLALMPVSMALAGPVGEAIGIPTTFVVAGALPVVLALAAIALWRLPRDEIAHPLTT
ncbi:MFS transporter [Pseudonocardia parietis]|uniref:MFS family permease n=1 Tax=Pseudonocardia parietis TaxID=570936 RepID=A0ABS4VPF3_9PSEU|nr:MFS transporter [Pseudonocardia parietis]MBP2365812.1 MFS family permease [Pseudonocardia parietis]